MTDRDECKKKPRNKTTVNNNILFTYNYGAMQVHQF